MQSQIGKIIICSLLCLFINSFAFCEVTAQQRRVIKLYKSSGIVESMPVSFLDSIRFEYENIPAIDIDNPSISEDIEEYNKRMQWWNDARYGMFIHYGLYSVLAGKYEGKNLKGEDIKFQSYGPLNTIGNGVTRGGGAGSEWIMYEADIPRKEYQKLLPQFTGTGWNPKEIVELAKQSGLKYIILTAKHHEGFCLWDSEATDFDIASTPAGELWNGDMIAPLAEETRKAGLKFGLYFSHALDWTHEGGLGDIPELDRKQYSLEKKRNYMNKYTYPMLKELITLYKPDVLWWDYPVANPYDEFSKECLEIVKEESDYEIIHNDRLSSLNKYNKGDFVTPEQSMNEEEIMPNAEWCMTLNSSWGYNQYDNDYKTPSMILWNLLRCSKMGINLLFNIGPCSDGSILKEQQYILKVVGEWLSKNGEGVYKTSRSPFQFNFPYGPVTYSADDEGNKTLYYNIFYWDGSGRLYLPGIMNEVDDVELSFTQNSNLKFDVVKIDGIGLCLKNLPKQPFDSLCTQLKIKFNTAPIVREGIPEIERKISLPSYTPKYSKGIVTDFNSSDKHACYNWYHGSEIKYKIIVPETARYKVEALITAYFKGKVTCRFSDGTVLEGNNTRTSGVFGKDYNWQKMGYVNLNAGEYDIVVTSEQEDSWLKLRELRLVRE